jgi:hypothetical protein
MPFHVLVWIGTDCHHEIELPLSVVHSLKMKAFSGYTLTKKGIARLNVEAALIHVDHVQRFDICPSKRIIPQPEHVSLEHVPFEIYLPVRSLTDCRRHLSLQIKKVLRPDNAGGGERSNCRIHILNKNARASAIVPSGSTIRYMANQTMLPEYLTISHMIPRCIFRSSITSSMELPDIPPSRPH